MSTSQSDDVSSINAAQQPDDAYKWKAFAAIAISFTTMVMSMQMAFVALSAIAEDYGITLRSVTWVVIAQALTISALMLPMGRFADIIGRKRVHLIGLVLFAAGAAGSAFSPTFGILIVFRVVMAVGNAMGQSVGMAMVVSVFPERERGKAIGSQTTAVAVGGSLGPIIAGLVLQWFPWETLFLMLLVPIGIAFIAGLFVLDEQKVSRGRSTEKAPFDWLGAALSAMAITLLVITINNPSGASWVSPLVLGSIAAVIVLLAAFVTWELKSSSPMLELRMFSNYMFTLGISTRILGFMGTTATRFLLPIFLISFRGLTEGTAGLILFLTSLGMGMAAQTSGRLSDKFGERRFLIFGFVILIATAIAFTFVDGETPMGTVMVIVFFNGLAMGLWNVPNSSVIMGSVPPSRFGVVGALTNLARNFGNVTGQAIASTIVVGVMVSRGFDIQLDEIADTPGAGAAFADGWRAAYIVVTGFSVIGLVMAILTKPGPRARDEDGG
ncbi:MAG: MFS transporter [Chloroflexi bacterium]|jgi:EmrB/QacA subfamily drug resistance transporter|nr:MFS transporter [Chloroflexota bacterium]MBT4074694.1 MFS transporter [Chloroflexota bacterium]MBT6681497.1 MFS transporter [Chloroflexota bacterium]MBT7243801.1 MFS transporter [Flavobacteriaceae bacterium]